MHISPNHTGLSHTVPKKFQNANTVGILTATNDYTVSDYQFLFDNTSQQSAECVAASEWTEHRVIRRKPSTCSHFAVLVAFISGEGCFGATKKSLDLFLVALLEMLATKDGKRVQR